MHKICRAFDQRDPVDKITDILLQKQLEQIDKVQKSFVKEITVQQNLTKRRFDDKVIRTENRYAKLLESRNMTNIWLEMKQGQDSPYKLTRPNWSCKISRKNGKSLLSREKTEIGTSSTGGGNKTEDSMASKTAETRLLAPLKRLESWRLNNAGYKAKFQRNVTFVNPRTLPTDLGNNPKVTPIIPLRHVSQSGEYCNPGKVESWRSIHSSAKKHRRQDCYLQSHCWGSKFFSNRRTPRRHNESRRYNKIGSSTKDFLDVGECFANISLRGNSDNYESKIKDFCDSLKHLILTSTTDN